MPIRVTQLEPGLDYASAVASQFDPAEYPAHVSYDPGTGLATKYFSDPVIKKPVDPADPPADTGDFPTDMLARLDKIVARLDELLADQPTAATPGNTPLWKKWLGLG